MAKKSKKSKKSMLLLVTLGVALIFAVLAIVFSLVLDFAGTKLVVSSSVREGTIYKGTAVIFGTKDDSGNQLLQGSGLGLAAFIMLIVGAVILLAGTVFSAENAKSGKLFGVIGGLVLIAAGIIMFIVPSNFVKINADELNSLLSTIGGLISTKFEVASSVKIGAILSGVFGIVSGVAGLGSAAIK